MTVAPETIWAIFDEDFSAQTRAVYAADTPDGFTEKPARYTLTTTVDAREKAAFERGIRAAVEAVGCISAPVSGTPYSAGPREFIKAIEAVKYEDIPK